MRNLLDRRKILLSPLLLAAGACAWPEAGVRASGATNKGDEFSRLIQFRVLQQHGAYAAVGVTETAAGPRYIAVRDPAATDKYLLDRTTIFEIASLTKVFTALLLADEVTRGRMRLDDPLQDYLPDGVTAPSFDQMPITLADLATHNSGLPLRPNNLAASAPDSLNKYAGYSLEQLYSGLPNYRLSRAPGTGFEYSNLAFGLLGQVIARREGKTFAEILNERIIEPLGMRDTSLVENPQKVMRRAAGHDFYFDPVDPQGDTALSPAMGLRSTCNDLLKFLDLFLFGKRPQQLKAAADLMFSVDRAGDDDNTRMALGWRRTTIHGETYYWSNGSADGARAFMGFNLARKTAVVILADTASGPGFDDIGRRALDPQQPVETSIVARPKFVQLRDEQIDRVIGRYEYAPDDVIDISRGATSLIVSFGPNQLIFRPVSKFRFESVMAPGLIVEFEGAEAGPAATLVLREGEATYIYRRIS